MKLKKADISGAVISPERLRTLADGVFAIVMAMVMPIPSDTEGEGETGV